MLKVKVSGIFYYKTGHKTNDRKNFEEEFVIHEKFEKNPLKVVQRMLIDARLKGVHPKFLGKKTCGLDGAVLINADMVKLNKEEIFNLKDHEILEYKAMKGVFIQGTKLGHIRTYREELIEAAPNAPVKEDNQGDEYITPEKQPISDSSVNLDHDSEFSSENDTEGVNISPGLDNEFEERV